ncbi:MAG: acylphosphatase [Euryarchaeota archaeon]|nr:acylphosphatase [Euryarchaeota archaeon]
MLEGNFIYQPLALCRWAIMPLMRTEFVVSGRVQKAGYRYFVDQKAYEMKITGTVENWRDGTVRIVAEGEERDVRQFQDAIKVEEYPIRVEEVRKVREEEIEKRAHNDFVIIRGWKEGFPGEIADRLDMAAHYLRTTNKDIGSKIDKFQKTTADSFADLEIKYGTVSKSLEEIVKSNQEIAKTNQATAQNIKEIARSNQETSKHLSHLSQLVEKIAEERARR